MSENEPQPVEGEPAPQPPHPDEVDTGEAPEGVASTPQAEDQCDQESAGEPVPPEPSPGGE
jgi:hypothetical protein